VGHACGQDDGVKGSFSGELEAGAGFSAFPPGVDWVVFFRELHPRSPGPLYDVPHVDVYRKRSIPLHGSFMRIAFFD